VLWSGAADADVFRWVANLATPNTMGIPFTSVHRQPIGSDRRRLRGGVTAISSVTFYLSFAPLRRQWTRGVRSAEGFGLRSRTHAVSEDLLEGHPRQERDSSWVCR
jgi:hypothetical protein